MPKPFRPLTDVRNRLVGLEYHRPADLLDHPMQWRTHPPDQVDAMQGVLEEVGIAGPLKIYRSTRAGGALVKWDGHLRANVADVEWPCELYDLTDEEADYLLAVHDPLSAMAGANAELLDGLLASITSEDSAVQALLAATAQAAGLYLTAEPPEADQYTRKIEAPIYQVTGEKPSVRELYDDSTTQQMLTAIAAADYLTADERAFLTIAARRHTVLHYRKIAEFYAHADAQIQRLMEDSALVIIDFNRAIELGFVHLAEAIASQYKADYGDA